MLEVPATTLRPLVIMFMRRAAAAAAAAAAASVAAPSFSKNNSSDSKSEKKKDPPPKNLADLMMQLTLRGRHVFLTGHIDDESAKAVIATLMYLEQESPGTPIRLHINSGGGKVQAGMAIHDAMNSIHSPVHTVCHGTCSSMAAILLACGAAGNRSAAPNARIMIHQPVRTTGGKDSSNARQLQIHAQSIEKSRLRIAELLALRTGKPVSEIEALIEYDHVCDAGEAQKLGLIDRITRPGELVPVDLQAVNSTGVSYEAQIAAAEKASVEAE